MKKQQPDKTVRISPASWEKLRRMAFKQRKQMKRIIEELVYNAKE